MAVMVEHEDRVGAASMGRLSMDPLARVEPRPFGTHASDLEVQFETTDRAQTTTQVLALCFEKALPDLPLERTIWALSLSDRLVGLLRLLSVSRPGALSIPVRCPAAGCGETLEFELTVEEITEIQAQAAAHLFLDVDTADGTYRIRRPTGLDQQAWRSKQFPSSHEALVDLIDRLSSRIEPEIHKPAASDASSTMAPELTGADMDRIGEALEQLDPLSAFSVLVECPQCGARSEAGVDLEQHALRQLRSVQRCVLREVHQLAGYYHWSEPEILELPAWRRSEYLGLIERERSL